MQGNFLCVLLLIEVRIGLTIGRLSILQYVRFVVCVDYKDRVREESARWRSVWRGETQIDRVFYSAHDGTSVLHMSHVCSMCAHTIHPALNPVAVFRIVLTNLFVLQLVVPSCAYCIKNKKEYIFNLGGNKHKQSARGTTKTKINICQRLNY